MLTDKKKLYVHAIRAGETKKDAAVKAGYSKKSASQAASRLEKDDDVKVYSRLLDDRESAPDDVGDASEDMDSKLPYVDPRDFLLYKMNYADDEKSQIDAAKTLMPYEHKKLGETGKKEGRQERAKASVSKFTPRVVV